MLTDIFVALINLAKISKEITDDEWPVNALSLSYITL
jgi:hypothetical protein